jgi:hypothetical protein
LWHELKKSNDLTVLSVAAIAIVLQVATEIDEQVLLLLGIAALNYAPTNLSQFSP